jgi:ABC-2 type transport system permease protein
LAAFNPFTKSVELIRFALYGQLEIGALYFTISSLLLFLFIAIQGYNPSRGMMVKKRGR